MNVITSLSRWHTLCRSHADVRCSLGLVPTMGALHAGHLSLVARARKENELVAATSGVRLGFCI